MSQGAPRLTKVPLATPWGSPGDMLHISKTLRLIQQHSKAAHPAIAPRTKGTRQQIEALNNTKNIRKHDPETGLVTSAIRLRVEDNGPGIPADLKDRIFFPMVSGRPQGSGIGLSITQSIISRHHGWIEVNSVPGLTQVDVIIPFGGYE